MIINEKITIAISKGRILKESLNVLKKIDLTPLESINDERKLIHETNINNIWFVIVRATDVPTYVSNGSADLGIVGKDTIMEFLSNDYYVPLDLKISKCRLVLASLLDDREYGNKIRVATKYPITTKDYFIKKKKQVDIIKLYGSMELAPVLGLADYIVDLVDTGETLRVNGLKEVETICDISANLIVNKASMKLKHESAWCIINNIEKILLEK